MSQKESGLSAAGLFQFGMVLQEGDTFVPISEIILKGEYTIDHTGWQCPK